jgi:hypothetical protein
MLGLKLKCRGDVFTLKEREGERVMVYLGANIVILHCGVGSVPKVMSSSSQG